MAPQECVFTFCMFVISLIRSLHDCSAVRLAGACAMSRHLVHPGECMCVLRRAPSLLLLTGAFLEYFPVSQSVALLISSVSICCVVFCPLLQARHEVSIYHCYSAHFSLQYRPFLLHVIWECIVGTHVYNCYIFLMG